MDTGTSASQARPIGSIFTPEKWARFAVKEFYLLSSWLRGATICDPTAGEGALLFALCDEALRSGNRLDKSFVSRLFYCDREAGFAARFQDEFAARYHLDFPSRNLFVRDVVLDPPRLEVDILFGNPPWANFTDLPDAYKTSLKSHFLRANLVLSKRDLLLGRARIDLAALVVATTIHHMLTPKGRAVFFLPLSLFLNDGAHAGFRRYVLPTGESYAVSAVYDFDDEPVFGSVSTRFGVAAFEKGPSTQYPIPFHVYDGRTWRSLTAAPHPLPTSPLQVRSTEGETRPNLGFELVRVRSEQQPRQGVNTCGANEALLFDNRPTDLPADLLYPLVSRDQFEEDGPAPPPRRFILLPYDRTTGRPLDGRTIQREYPSAWDYLLAHQERLKQRRGTFIRSWIKRGYWWSCLGVGPYSFAAYKVLWQAYGAKLLNPIVLTSYNGQPWQGNQAMHAYMPCSTRLEADRLKNALSSPAIQSYLASSRMQGTCNWAQPGRVKLVLDMSHGEQQEACLFAANRNVELESSCDT